MQTLETQSVARNSNAEPKWRVVGTQSLPLSRISLPSVEIRFDPKITSEFVSQVRIGIIDPVVVRKVQKNRYEIIKGVRRFLAARRAGFSEIKCMIVEVKDENVWQIVLLENTAREDLSPMDLAGYVSYAMEKYRTSQNEIAQMIGKDKSTLSNLLRVFHNPILREEVRCGYHSLQTAIELETIAPRQDAGVEELEHFESFVNKTRGLSVKQIRYAIIVHFLGKKRKLRCNRCKTIFDQGELSDFKVCFKCQKKMGLERLRRVKIPSEEEGG